MYYIIIYKLLNFRKKNYYFFLNINLKKKKKNYMYVYNNKVLVLKLYKKKFIYESQLFYNFNAFIHYFNSYIIKKNFSVYISYNDIKISFFYSLLSFFNNIVKTKLFYFKNKFCIYFFFNLFCFFYFKNNNIILNFIFFFVKRFNFKKQRTLNTMFISVFSYIKQTTLKNYGLLGCQIKIKGKYTQRPGDRRKVYFYRIGSFSYSNPVNKYIISHRQLRDKSGASGCTVISMLL